MHKQGGRDPYLQPYREAAKRHGSDFAVTLWANRKSQELRFDVFRQMCFLTGKRILDAGCSRGDFAAFLLKRDVAFEHYVGIDALAEVIDYAAGRGLPRCEFRCGDFVTQPELLSIGKPQVICISGALNTMTDEQVRTVLGSAWAAAGETLLFNFLSDRAQRDAPPQDAFARRLNTLDMLDWALGRTWHVVFRQDYFKSGHDATILMRKTQ
ncbi:MAG: methyltransferase domain-containing protein [Phycisphaeraceae bacterium]